MFLFQGKPDNSLDVLEDTMHDLELLSTSGLMADGRRIEVKKYKNKKINDFSI